MIDVKHTNENMTVTTNEFNQHNIFPREPQMYITEEDMTKHFNQTHNEKAEIWNSRAAMLGVVMGIISYALTGKLFFGIF
jgi:hypothetical protein